MTKVSKQSVSYRLAERWRRRCGSCSMYRPGGSCTLVRGWIWAVMVCDRWNPRTGKRNG